MTQLEGVTAESLIRGLFRKMRQRLRNQQGMGTARFTITGSCSYSYPQRGKGMGLGGLEDMNYDLQSRKAATARLKPLWRKPWPPSSSSQISC